MVRRVAVLGAAGRLGRELVRAFSTTGDEVTGFSSREFDLALPSTIVDLHLGSYDIVLNSAAWTDVDGCALDPDRAMRLNGVAAGVIAREAERGGALVVQLSTNEVFDGSARRPYLEDDETNPANPYGESKLAGEQSVISHSGRHLIVRTAWLFGPEGPSFVSKILAAARALPVGDALAVVDDEWGNPTWIPALAPAIVVAVALPDAERPPVVHLAGSPPVSRFGWAQRVFATGNVRLRPTRLADYARPSRVPPRAVLATRHSTLSEPGDWTGPTDRLVAQLSARVG